MSRSARLLLLLQALSRRRRAVTAAQLARELEVSERTIYRDLAELAAQGAPVEGDRYPGRRADLLRHFRAHLKLAEEENHS